MKISLKHVAALGMGVATLALSGAALADPVTFSYQGFVRVHGTPYDGSGQFKFAILSHNHSTTLWTNDGTAAGEPSAGVALPVETGVFSATIGDTGAGMQALDGAIFSSTQPRYLRTWFSDGTHGFQQLNPDFKLTDISLNTHVTGTSDYTIYVDGTTGNDANNGLTTSTAKKTVQAAVDIVPARVNCNLTVKIAAGTYRETVFLSNVGVLSGKALLFLGDESWTSTSVASPSVRISAASGETVASRGSVPAFRVDSSNSISFRGILFDGGTDGLLFRRSDFTVASCKATSCSTGMTLGFGSSGSFTDCVSDGNSVYGYGCGSGSFGGYTAITGRNNGFGAIEISHYGTGFVNGPTELSNNGAVAINLYQVGVVQFNGTGNQMYNNYSDNVQAANLSQVHNMPASSPNTIPVYGGWVNLAKDSSSWSF